MMRQRRPSRPDDPSDPQAAREQAISLLARREHGWRELALKLTRKGFDADAAEQAVAELADEGLQSETRYLEGYVRTRAERGYGPLRIRAELLERGVEEALAEAWIEPGAQAWRERAAEARRRRFGDEAVADARERARQMRFLQYRGFTHDQVRAVVGDTD